MENFKQFKKDFKRDVLLSVIVSMRRGDTSKGKAGRIAREILKAFSLADNMQVFEALLNISQTDPEILDIYIKRGNEFEVKDRTDKLNQIITYLKGEEK